MIFRFRARLYAIPHSRMQHIPFDGRVLINSLHAQRRIIRNNQGTSPRLYIAASVPCRQSQR